MKDYEQRPKCPKCHRKVENYFDHTVFNCVNLQDDELELRIEYVEWRRSLARAGIGATAPDFETWWRRKADDAKEEAKYAN